MSNRIENGTKKRIALDIFIIIVIAASLVGIILRCVLYSVNSQSGQGKAEYYMIVEIKDEYQSVAESLKPGDKVFMASDGEMIGAIMREEQDNDTEADVTTEVTTRPGVPKVVDSVVNIVLTEGKAVEGSFLVGNREYLTPGDTVELYTAGTVFSAHIVRISKLPDTYQ